MISRKTIRFYDTPKDKQALTALSNFKDYGFDSENSMMVSALCSFLEQNSSHQTTYSPEKLANLIAEQLKGKLHVSAETETTATTNNSNDDSPSLVEMELTDAPDDGALSEALEFMNMF